MTPDTAIKYAFYTNNNVRGNGGRGDGRLLLDIEKLVISHFGFPPVYSNNDREALSDSNVVIISVNPYQDNVAWADNWVGVYARNDISLGGLQIEQCDVILNPVFNPIEGSSDGKSLLKKFEAAGGAVRSVDVLPSRATPTDIASAAEELKETRPQLFADQKSPITTLVVGSLADLSFSEKEIIEKIRDLVEKRNGSVLMTTSHRTGSNTEARLVKALKPWLVEPYLWGKKDSYGDRPNPYLAYLGLADEIIVTGDSLSMVSDVVTTGQPFRLIFGDTTRQRGHSSSRLVGFLHKKGVEDLLLPTTGSREEKSYEIMPPPLWDYGINAAISEICRRVEAKTDYLKQVNTVKYWSLNFIPAYLGLQGKNKALGTKGKLLFRRASLACDVLIGGGALCFGAVSGHTAALSSATGGSGMAYLAWAYVKNNYRGALYPAFAFKRKIIASLAAGAALTSGVSYATYDSSYPTSFKAVFAVTDSCAELGDKFTYADDSGKTYLAKVTKSSDTKIMSEGGKVIEMFQKEADVTFARPSFWNYKVSDKITVHVKGLDTPYRKIGCPPLNNKFQIQ